MPSYVRKIRSNLRVGDKNGNKLFYSDKYEYEYDAYQKVKNVYVYRKVYINFIWETFVQDIAVVHFYFENPTVFQFSRDIRMTIFDFVSQVRLATTYYMCQNFFLKFN